MQVYQLKQKIWSLNDSYYIKTAEGTPTFQISGKIFSLAKQISIRNMAGTEVLKIKQTMLALSPNFELIRNGKTVASISKKGWFFDKTYELDVPGPNDYTIKGKFLSKEFEFYRQEKVVARVTKNGNFFAGNYGIIILQEEDHDLILATAIVMDLISKDS